MEQINSLVTWIAKTQNYISEIKFVNKDEMELNKMTALLYKEKIEYEAIKIEYEKFQMKEKNYVAKNNSSLLLQQTDNLKTVFAILAKSVMEATENLEMIDKLVEFRRNVDKTSLVLSDINMKLEDITSLENYQNIWDEFSLINIENQLQLGNTLMLSHDYISRDISQLCKTLKQQRIELNAKLLNVRNILTNEKSLQSITEQLNDMESWLSESNTIFELPIINNIDDIENQLLANEKCSQRFIVTDQKISNQQKVIEALRTYKSVDNTDKDGISDENNANETKLNEEESSERYRRGQSNVINNTFFVIDNDKPICNIQADPNNNELSDESEFSLNVTSTSETNNICNREQCSPINVNVKQEIGESLLCRKDNFEPASCLKKSNKKKSRDRHVTFNENYQFSNGIEIKTLYPLNNFQDDTNNSFEDDSYNVPRDNAPRDNASCDSIDNSFDEDLGSSIENDLFFESDGDDDVFSISFDKETSLTRNDGNILIFDDDDESLIDEDDSLDVEFNDIRGFKF